MNSFRRKPELFGNYLRVSRLVSLPGRLRTDQHRHIAVRIEPHIGGLFAHRAADFHIGRHADAAQKSCLLRNLGALRKFLPRDNLLCAFHVRGEIAGVVNLVGRSFVRHRFRRNEILLADGVRRHSQFACGNIDKTLQHIGRFGTACAAIGINRNGVGEHTADAAVKRLNIVETRQHA